MSEIKYIQANKNNKKAKCFFLKKNNIKASTKLKRQKKKIKRKLPRSKFREGITVDPKDFKRKVNTILKNA